MDNEKQFHFRSIVILGIFSLCLAAFTGLLYSAQVVHHDDYLDKSTTQVTRTETIETSRGIITDRNGKVLVTNREIYTVSFDPSQVPKGESAAQAALRLVELFQDQGLTWTDTLPISPSYPFSYTTASAGVSSRTRFEKYLNALGWSDSVLTEESPIPVMTSELKLKLGAVTDTLTAPAVMALLRERFKLDEGVPEDQRMSEGQARLVIGVLYEAELRTLRLKNYYIPPYVFAEEVSVEIISILNDGGFSGVVIDQESVRQYNTDYAAHILGRVGAVQSTDDLDQLNDRWAAAQGLPEGQAPQSPYRQDDQLGRDGVERAFETYLRGIEGKRIITTNESGKITGELYAIDPQPGGTVALTIDIDFQAAVEEALGAAVEEMNAEDGLETRGGAAAVVSIADGDILALASYPNFSQRTYFEDMDTYSEDPGNPFFNRALSAYPPGSTYKPMVAVAAMETGVITPTSKILTKGIYRYYETDNPATSYTPKCWLYSQSGGSHGLINVSQAIYHSCNYFFYEIGRLMGIETIDQYAAAFGLGQPTGIELGESTGTLAGPEYSAQMGQLWYDGNTLQAAIGQSDNTFTPLQLASYTATLVRGGQRYSTHLLQSVRSHDGSQLLYEDAPQVLSTVDIAPATLAAVKKGMGDLTAPGGSLYKYFEQCVVTAGAKTGSAQTGEKVANGVFICFAPFDEPEIAVAVVIEKGGSGSALATTAVNILNAYFDQSDIGTALLPEGALLP